MSFYVFSLIVFSVFSVTISLCYVSLALIIRIPGIAFKKCRIYFKIRRMNHCKFIKALSLFFSRCESKKKLYQNMILLAVFSLEYSFHFKRNMILINFVYLFKKKIFFLYTLEIFYFVFWVLWLQFTQNLMIRILVLWTPMIFFKYAVLYVVLFY